MRNLELDKEFKDIHIKLITVTIGQAVKYI